MRISTSQVFLNNVDALSRANGELFKTQQQIATGKNILQPSDDPLASAQIIKLKKEIARTEQFQSNIDASKRRLELEEITLDQMFNQTVRLRELSVQAGNGILSQADRESLASEVDQIINQMYGLMNTKDAQGEYLFSGFKGETQAYAYDAASEQYVYQGDSGQRFIQVGPSNQIASTDSGLDLFERLSAGVEPRMVNDLNDAVAALAVSDMEAFEQADAAGKLPFNISIATDAMGSTLTVTSADGSEAFAGPVGVGSTVSFNGMDLEVGNVPVLGDPPVEAEIQARPRTTNVLNAALTLSRVLKDSEMGQADFSASIADTLDALGQAEEANIRARTSIGGRTNALEQQELVNEDVKLFTTEALSSFEDLDYAEAISRFTLQQTVLEAAYSSFNQIRNLSLFNYIQ
ncbi:flagellar hook-associated protein FlgL [Marinobacterium aestuariivivens]|uniref:Flagellar hook-associated protein FlgL n=1 Tax=Marinobacterium aestuariivivens TaxID=1698799 RepID=A0ABW1ZX77_9GAMM